MKKNVFIILLGVFSLLFASCDSDSKDYPLGPSGDVIKLSQKEATFSSESNTITITSQYKGWWIYGIFMDKSEVAKGEVNLLAENFVFKNADFQIEKKEGNTLIITMNKNTTNKERLLTVGLEAGNYFNHINITQAK